MRKRRFDCRLVAALEPVGQVARRFVPEKRRPCGKRRRRIDHRRQGPVRDLDELGRITRLLPRIGNDKRHRVADVADPVARQGPARRHDHWRDCRHLGDARQGADAVRLEIGRGENAPHPRHRPRSRGIDAVYRGVSVRRAQHNPVQLIGHVDVIDIAAAPGEKPLVFEAAQRAPDMRLGHPAAPAERREVTHILRHRRRGDGQSSR